MNKYQEIGFWIQKFNLKDDMAIPLIVDELEDQLKDAEKMLFNLRVIKISELMHTKLTIKSYRKKIKDLKKAIEFFSNKIVEKAQTEDLENEWGELILDDE